MKKPLTVEEIRALPEPKNIQDQMIEVVEAFRAVERRLAGNIALAYWRGKQEDVDKAESEALARQEEEKELYPEKNL